jgi:type IV pilus assembly protein PilE
MKTPSSPLYAQPGNRPQGFSLIELLIALACIAALVGWAWPNYQQLLQRSQRAQARTALLQTAHWLERAASANGSYPAASEVPASVLQTEGLRYQLSVTSSAQSFSLTATPVGAQVGDACGSFTLSHTGTRGVLNATLSMAQCWGR